MASDPPRNPVRTALQPLILYKKLFFQKKNNKKETHPVHFVPMLVSALLQNLNLKNQTNKKKLLVKSLKQINFHEHTINLKT